MIIVSVSERTERQVRYRLLRPHPHADGAAALGQGVAPHCRSSTGSQAGRRARLRPFLASGHLYFDSLEAFQSAFAAHAEAIMADAPSYTNTQPVIQISEARV